MTEPDEGPGPGKEPSDWPMAVVAVALFAMIVFLCLIDKGWQP